MKLLLTTLLVATAAATAGKGKDIVQLAEATPDLSTLVTAVSAAGLVKTLESPGPFTVFAPTNEAFSALPAGVVASLLKPENKAQLADVLTYHVVAGAAVHAKDLSDGQIIKTVEGKALVATVNTTGVFINDAQVTTADVDASNGVVHIIDAVLLPAAAPKAPTPAPAPTGKTIYDIAVATPDLSTLATAIKTGELVGAFASGGPFTVFAPTNEAFDALPAGTVASLLKPENAAKLQGILWYHVLKGVVRAKDLKNGQELTTMQGGKVKVAVTASGVFINNAQVTTADVDASNGVVHIIDAVLLPAAPKVPTPAPAPAGKDIVQLAEATPDLSTLVTAVSAAGLVKTLESPGPFTVFAPTNEAFSALPAGVVANLLKPENKAQLADVLTYHVVAGAAVHAKDLSDGQIIKTVEGKALVATVNTTGVFINDAQVTTADVDASNGVVHIIDAVLLPAAAPKAPTPAPAPTGKTIYDIAVATPDLSTLATAIKTGELVGAFASGGPFTVFAPTNEAFDALPAGTVASLLKPENSGKLDDILKYHAVAGAVHAKDLKDGQLINTLLGKTLRATVNATGVFINGNAMVVTADVDASNGVAHVIDAVLLP